MSTKATPESSQGVRTSASSHSHPDLLDLARHLSAEEQERLQRIEAYVQENVRHQSIEPWHHEQLPIDMLHGLGDLGVGELFLDGSSQLFQGLAHIAVARADVSISAVVGIHNELIVGTIESLGSAEQKEHWLPGLRRLRTLGAFCLTEPDHGSDIAGGLATSATFEGNSWRIRGSKRWIGLGTVADVAVIWARDTSDGHIKGFLVPTDTPGYRAHKITNKTGLRIMQNAELELDLTLPESALMPKATSFAATSEGLRGSRAWVGWQAVGAQQALLDTARHHALTRTQFGKPLASFQLVQTALATMAGNLAVSTAFMGELARLQEANQLTMLRATLAKATLTRLARESAATARDVLGGNGILSTHEVAKIAGDIDAIYTYEGSYGINMLIAGRELTGVSAFV
ncbi:acyl-CoA dehydrogenase family protein [Nesterenkonia haasae]|uniref:acyl-CoA dehydrogenase family protein n=1 Tax=Nesterenkonia haasae TaxID=2587813 RepID=UPI001391C8C0|nr:acyl-CoA dehydrogenase family protein [Nesterenkonia haasae]NDK32084.1 acyl-CoA dehydrogenase [Nesterenkonia haasae]